MSQQHWSNIDHPNKVSWPEHGTGANSIFTIEPEMDRSKWLPLISLRWRKREEKIACLRKLFSSFCFAQLIALSNSRELTHTTPHHDRISNLPALLVYFKTKQHLIHRLLCSVLYSFNLPFFVWNHFFFLRKSKCVRLCWLCSPPSHYLPSFSVLIDELKMI